MLVAVAAVVVSMAAGKVGRPATAEAPVASPASIPAATSAADRRATCLGAAAVAPGDRCAGVDLGSTVYPPAAAVSQDSDLQYDCFTQAYGKLVSCHYGSSASDARRVAFVGDNRAASLLPGILPLLPSEKWSLTTYIGDGCVLSTTRIERCSGAQSQIIAALTKKNAYDLVITTADRSDGLTAASFTPVFDRVRASGAKLAVVRDIPRPSSAALACSVKDTRRQEQTCTTPRATALLGADPLVQAAAASGAALIDLTPYFCTAQACSSVVGNVVVYRDGGADLTTTFSRTLGPFLIDAVKSRLQL